MVYSQLYLLRGPSNRDQHRKHHDSPCCQGGVTVPYVISFFSLSSLNNMSLWSENKFIKSTLHMCQSSGKLLFVAQNQERQWSYTTAYSQGDKHTCMHTHRETPTHTQIHLHLQMQTHIRRKTHTHTHFTSIHLLFRTAVVLE